jgi:hypothetical protein
MAAALGQSVVEHFFNVSDICPCKLEELINNGDGPTPGRPDAEPEICRGS